MKNILVKVTGGSPGGTILFPLSDGGHATNADEFALGDFGGINNAQLCETMQILHYDETNEVYWVQFPQNYGFQRSAGMYFRVISIAANDMTFKVVSFDYEVVK